MEPLLGIDWGTSSLRGALLDARGTVLDARTFDRGIVTVEGGEFEQVFATLFGDWMRRARMCLMSGMIGSKQGWREAPYCPCPAGFDDIAAHLLWLTPAKVAIVPGVSCVRAGIAGEPEVTRLHDVMRGEETQILGALRRLALHDATLVLPGTHSKWVRVCNDRVTEFTTFMTGEVFGLLRRHSILARTMPEASEAADDAAFLLGVRVALKGASLLSTAFTARTVALFDNLAAQRRADFLSGLVIGEELRAQQSLAGSVVIVGSDALTRRYRDALGLIGVAANCVGAEATWAGLLAIAESIERSGTE